MVQKPVVRGLSDSSLRHLALGGGVVDVANGRLLLPPLVSGYGDAQVDDYGRCPARRHYPWSPGTMMRLTARFSHQADQLVGTAGFGFWNAPFGDPTLRWPALPQAAWYFFASAPTDIPLAPHDQPGRGWFAATLDATKPAALALAPLAPFFLLLNQVPGWRRRFWPLLRRRLGISFMPLVAPMDTWHTYQLDWQERGCTFTVDGTVVLQTEHSPRGPLGFVCWLDNQYLVAKVNGRFAWGTLSTSCTQWLEIADLTVGTRF